MYKNANTKKPENIEKYQKQKYSIKISFHADNTVANRLTKPTQD